MDSVKTVKLFSVMHSRIKSNEDQRENEVSGKMNVDVISTHVSLATVTTSRCFQ